MAKTLLDFWTTWTPELAYILGFAFADGGIGKDGTISQIVKRQAWTHI